MFNRFDPKFEPAGGTVESMLFVRKKPMLLAGIRHPGFFGIHAFTADWILVVIVLVLEFIGIAAIYNVLSQGETSVVAAGLTGAAAFAVDIFVALIHHKYSTGINAKLEVENILSNRLGGTNRVIDVAVNNDRLRSRKRTAFLLSVTLIILAAIKFGAFFLLSAGQDEMEYGPIAFMAVVYLATAMIHIKATGYWFSGLVALRFYNRDVNKFKTSKGTECRAMMRNTELADVSDFAALPIVGSHKIVHETPAGGSNLKYILRTEGLLMDAEIEEFVNRFLTAEARTEFTLKAMELQKDMLPA